LEAMKAIAVALGVVGIILHVALLIELQRRKRQGGQQRKHSHR
jgi:hypothetical protein